MHRGSCSASTRSGDSCGCLFGGAGFLDAAAPAFGVLKFLLVGPGVHADAGLGMLGHVLLLEHLVAPVARGRHAEQSAAQIRSHVASSSKGSQLDGTAAEYVHPSWRGMRTRLVHVCELRTPPPVACGLSPAVKE